MRVYEAGEKVLGPGDQLYEVVDNFVMDHPTTEGKHKVVYKVKDTTGKTLGLRDDQVRTPPKV